MRKSLVTPVLAVALASSALVVAEEGRSPDPDARNLKPGAKFAVQRFTYYSARNQTANERSSLVDFAKGTVVIRSGEELVAHSARPARAKDAAVQKELSQALAKSFKVDAIDWNKQMVIGVNVRLANVNNYVCHSADAIHFTSLRLDGKNLTVQYKVDRGVAMEMKRRINGIQGLALVDRFDGEIKFADQTAP